MFSRRISISAAAVAVVLVTIAITAALGAIIFIAREDRASANQTLAAETSKLTLYQTARAAALTETTYIAAFVILSDPESLDVVETSRREIDAALLALEPLDETGDATRFRAEHARVKAGYDRVIDALLAGDFGPVLASRDDGLADQSEQFLMALGGAVERSRVDLLAAQTSAQSEEQQSDTITLVIVGTWCVLLLGAALALRYTIARPLDRVATAARRIAEGDVAVRAPEAGPAEVAHLARDLNLMAETLIQRSEDLGDRGTELEAANRKLAALLNAERERARRDPLTGALNHGALAERLRAMLSPESGVDQAVLAMIDVNGLKDINDTFGHQTGDEVLRRVAAALNRDNAVVGRYGGDEFVALLAPCDDACGARYREAVLAAMDSEDFRDSVTGARVPISASVGLASYPAEGARIEEIIARADSSMYAAKRQRPQAGATRLSMDTEMATRMVGELVPLMAAAGTLDEKLGIIAQRLSQGTGYAGANFDVFEEGAEEVRDRNTSIGTNAYTDAPDEIVDEWRAQQRTNFNHPISEVMREHLRPIIIDDLATTAFVTEEQRRILAQVKILSAIVVPLIWQGEFIGTMAVGSREPAAFTPRDAQFLTTVAAHVSAIIRSARMVEQLRLATEKLAASHGETVLMLAASVEAHDDTTGRHLMRVRTVTEALADELGLPDDETQALGVASMLHDIGKVRVPDVVLKSPDRLSEDEWITMKQHTSWGAEFLESHQGFELAAVIARAHHERWDGSGYPHGLVGDAIPLAAQIVSVADAYDAMISDRPYRAGRSPRRAVREIFAHGGTQFSPRVVAALLRLYRRHALPGDEREPERIAA